MKPTITGTRLARACAGLISAIACLTALALPATARADNTPPSQVWHPHP